MRGNHALGTCRGKHDRGRAHSRRAANGTWFYRAGIAFLSWLKGHQTDFIMPAGFQSSRDITHYAQVFRLADAAGLLSDPDLAEARMQTLLALHGIDQD
ncbi:DUF993 family protein [Rhodobacter calidifons]|nr:DUF993 family protein [Rhodobacter calidifons]